MDIENLIIGALQGDYRNYVQFILQKFFKNIGPSPFQACPARHPGVATTFNE